MPPAQFNVCTMNYNGQGVPVDYNEALNWCGKAAGQGLAMAQNYLGQMYVAGRAAPRDFAEAVKWFRKAAEQGLRGSRDESRAEI